MTVRRVWNFVRQYWQFSGAVVALGIALLLQIFKLHTAANWVLIVASAGLTLPLIAGMWEDFRAGSYGLDVLALTAIVASLLLHQYWAAIVIVLMLTGGETLEVYADRRARSELKALLERAPTQAHVLRGRKVLDVAASDIQVNDKILIKPGEVVPVDAIILEGKASFDESSLTGESLPVSKGVGEEVLSGSINLDAALTAKALHAAADSQYQQIVRLVSSAAAQQAPFVRLADRYSIPFTISAYAIAIAAWAVGHHAIRFLEVIVVATPCPLLLAAPIALISGMSRASKYGIIVRNGAALEKLAEAETFAFDKTGTLTNGQPVVEEITALKPYSKNEILGFAASLEQASNHVLARAVVNAANEKHYSFAKAKHIQEQPGGGLKAALNGKEILVGNYAFLLDHSITVPIELVAQTTASYVVINGELAGVITFKDEARAESKHTLETLRKLGIKHFSMVTGDNQATADTIAKELGITQVLAQASPGDKLHAIEKLEHHPVAFVGDGVNDAPVLTAADIGIALGARGSTAASESADIVIMQDDISYVAKAVKLARRTFGIAKQSILVGIMLSLVLMLVFATGKFSPLLGAILQEVVDVFVIFNALRAHTSRV